MRGIAAIAADAVLYIRIKKLIVWNRSYPFLEEHVPPTNIRHVLRDRLSLEILSGPFVE